ncbi:PREDICTED: protein TIME FOR COFFEE isoform X2 [Tarenaya hassleriana]|uniref:protein TIME FOR COFFEE isoform X2 n=1 Tax=Tarenaya hassleriana TaxID=28532 RepID=UPI00053C4040|nr:PREDICTED: protein TIME FOR COFFEE isoform X2 [Tarenaya hassleriana]
MAASNGLPRRRQRGSDDGDTEIIMQERVRLMDRPEKKERDSESLNRSKRRRSERFAVKNGRDAEEDSSGESLGDEGIPISQNSASFRQNYLRKSFPPARVPRHATAKTGMDPSLKIADEMIGVPVPRKARSACIKRAHDGRTSSGSGGGGFGRPPSSPASYSFETASPSSSTVSVKQKMNANELKSRVPKPLISSGTSEDDLEFEIAEVLSGLKQSRSSRKDDDSQNSLKLYEVKENGSITYTARTETGRSGNIETSMEEPEKSPRFNQTTGIDAAEASSAALDTQTSAQKLEQSCSPVDVMERKRLDFQDSTATKGASEGPQSKNGREESNANNKLQIDLMVPPPMPSLPERDSLPLVSGPNPIAQDYNKVESSEKSKEKPTGKKETSPDIIFGEKEVQNREWLKLDLEKPSQDNVRNSSLRLQNEDWSQQQQAKSAQPSSVLPLTIAVGGWPNGSGLPPLGYVPQLHTVKPVDGITGFSPKIPAAPSVVSQPRPKRCATHFFIARNIQLHQQFIKTNHVWVPNPGSVRLKGGGPYVAPPTAAEGLNHRSPSVHGSFPILDLNSLAPDKGIILANVPTQKDKAYESGHSAETTQKKPQLPAASSNLMSAPAFVFPINHHHHPMMGAANQTVPSKSPGPTRNPSLVGGSTSINFSYPSSSASEAPPYMTILPNHGYSFQVSTPPAVRGGVPGQAPPFFSGSLYSPLMFQPQLLQKQGQADKETSTSSGSSPFHKQQHAQVGGNSHLILASVQKPHLQSTAYQSRKSETKTSVDNSSFVSDSQKSSYSQNMTVPVQPLNFSMPFASFGGSGAPTSLDFTSKGNHIVHEPQVSQPKNQQQPSDAKSRDCSNNLEDPKRVVLGKGLPRTNGQTLVFDNSARTLNFASGTWLSSAVTAAIVNSTSTLKHHMLPQQQQSDRSKLIDANNLPATSLATKFPNSVPVFQQTYSLTSPVPAKSAQWKTPAISSPLTSCTSLDLKQFQFQQQTRAQGQTQISFATAPKPVLVQSSKGHQEKLSSCHPQYQASPALAAGSVPHGKTSPEVSNRNGPPSTISATAAQVLQQQQIENTASGSNQKSSAVCGRNMSSIISSCAGHLSGLKY